MKGGSVEPVQDKDENRFTNSCLSGDTELFPFKEQLADTCVRENEGFAAILSCGWDLNHICRHLGKDYKFLITPAVSVSDVSKRKNKKCGHTILRIKNMRTVAVIELFCIP